MDCWHHEIDVAQTEAEVVKSADDYLGLWAPREIEPMNLGLIDLHIDSPEDIERVKRCLNQSTVNAYSASPHAPHLRELASYFFHASSRIGEIRAGC